MLKNKIDNTSEESVIHIMIKVQNLLVCSLLSFADDISNTHIIIATIMQMQPIIFILYS